MTAESFWLIAGLLLVLTAASLVSTALQRRALGPNPTLENLDARIRAWWVMASLAVAALLLGAGAVTLLFALISFLALREFFTLSVSRPADHWVLLGVFVLIIPIQYWLVWTEWYGLFTIFIPVWCFLFMPALAVLRGDTTNFLHRIAETQWAVMACVYALSHVPALLTLPIPGFEGKQALLVAFLLVVVQGSDVLQYIAGKLWGRRKLAPSVSPSKTWEGFLGGVAAASLLGMALFWLTPFGPLGALGVALFISLMGALGGLVASAIKRDRRVKDWGQMIEGHGGVLDRMDGVVFAAPVFFHLLRYFAM
ncbi:MAG TPA: phosphatidate cytidylyltransferase [Mesorhizobium sp.]|jgi:phosphatidate cytidylyltransferase|nr:phosphatidate cytidylyltransferase [Mesorhizobium sp.]